MIKPYESYKKTNILWNKTTPTHWKFQRGKSIFTSLKHLNINYECNNILSLTLKGVVNNDLNNPIGLVPKDYATYQIFDTNNLVFKLIDLENFKTSRVGLVHEKGIMSSAYIRLVSKVDTSHKYFYYQYYDLYLRGIYNNLGAGVRSTLNASDLLNIGIVVPPRTEQDQIVRFLDWKLSKINKLIKAKKKQIDLLNEQKQAIINKAVTKGLDDNILMKDSGVKWIGDIPQDWEVNRLKRFCKINASISHLKLKYSDNDKLVFLPMENVSVKGDVDCSIKRLYKDIKSGYSSFAKNDVVVAKITPCFENGKGACLDKLETEIGYGTTEFITLRCYENIMPKYLYYITQISWFRLFGAEKMTGSAGQKRVPSDFIANFVLGIPNINVQKKIICFLENYISTTDMTILKIQAELDLVIEYSTSLISSVVRGKVDVRDMVVSDFGIENDF